MSSLCSSLRVSRKLRLISSNLYLLSVNLNLSRDASRLSGSSFFTDSWNTWFLLWIPRKLSWGGKMFDRDTGMSQLVWLFWYPACLSLNLCLCTLWNPGMWFLGWGRACESEEIVEIVCSLEEVCYIMRRCLLPYIMYPSSLKLAWILSLFLCGEFRTAVPGFGIAVCHIFRVMGSRP